MATITTNIGAVTERIRERPAKLRDAEYIPSQLAFDTIDLMAKRIHIDGKDANGDQIGTYSKGYMIIRTGELRNAVKFTRVIKEGYNKNAGIVKKKRVQLFGTIQDVFADITPMGVARIKYNRSSDTKVIISLTRQLENDWSVIATDKGYGVGFLNKQNLDKARWSEAT